MDEDVSVEPACDIQAQLEDLFRPGSTRLAVYLSPRNERAHASLRDPRIGMTYLLPGVGTLFFRSWNDLNIVEDRLWKRKEDLRVVIGEAVCAGSGKPEWTPTACVAQIRMGGAVARESIQPDASSAARKLEEWRVDCPHGVGRIVSIQDALARRTALAA